jgi:hypothetical protein
MADDFLGLEEGTNRYDLLLLVKKTGKAAGFTPRMIELLDYYMSYTRDIDWEEGHSPIVFQSLSRTAMDLDGSERQVQKLEKALFEAGAITWNDSGNHRRYGHRCPKTGEILYAYGVDLTPLAYLKPKLQDVLAIKEAHKAEWMQAKRQISGYRRSIRAMIAELEALYEEGDQTLELTHSYDRIAIQIRTHISLKRLQSLLAEHRALYQRSQACIEALDQAQEREQTEKRSPTSAEKCAHNKSTIQKQSIKIDTSKASPTGFQGRRNGNSAEEEGASAPMETSNSRKPDTSAQDERILATGIQHISLEQAINASSERYQEHLFSRSGAIDWQDYVEAAYALRSKLGISQNSWGTACIYLGRTGAAITLMLTDQASLRPDNPVRKPAGYFNAMIQRAQIGELHLHKSVFGILSRAGEGHHQDKPELAKIDNFD